MKAEINLQFPGLGATLAKLLPAGVEPTSLSITGTKLRIEAKAFGFKTVALTADVHVASGVLLASGFRVEGAFGLDGKVLVPLKAKIATLNERAGPFHVRGERAGESLLVTW